MTNDAMISDDEKGFEWSPSTKTLRVACKSLAPSPPPAMEILMDDVIDTHIHLSEHYSGGLKNSWHPKAAKGFQKDACWVMKRDERCL